MTGSMIGRVFNNRYQITERIGIGGMAEVYRAQDNVLGRLVAVKVMLPQYAADPSFTQRFKQEAAAAANLQSPYIVNVYDWGQDDGTYYIVMEFVRGSDLKTAINERGAINQRKVAEIGSQVCQALSVAHGLDIIHRDIKPQNIMVQPDGNVKVMDFGIARAKNSVKTQTSSVLGTAHYISPEQAQGKELTAASDIYSLGIVLYESATGHLPFDGPDAVSVAMKQVNDLPAPPHEFNPDIDPSLEAIIMKAMAKNPADRFATAKDMRLALNDYLAGRPVNLGDGFTSAETMVMGGVAPIVPPVADGTAVMPAMGGVGGVNPTVATQARSYRNDDNGGKKDNKKTIAIVIGIIAALAVVGGIAFALMSGMGGPSEDAVGVPSVIGKTVEEATTEIEGAGLALGNVEEVFDNKVEAGQVISQDPAGGTKKDKGTKVNLTVSKGTQEIAVPNLVGLTVEEAKKQLTANGLKFTAGPAEYSDDVEKDLIARQDIAPGEKVAKDTTITYYQSLGSEGVPVPNVVGMSEGNATTTLNNVNLYVSVESKYSDQPAGTVIAQNPSSGKLQEGSTVSITVSQGKQKVTYSVAVNSNGGGQVTTSATSVDEGGSVYITITPNAGYEVASVTGLNGVSSSGGTFTISNVSANVSVSVTFQQTSGGGGTTPDGGDAPNTDTKPKA